MIVEKYEIPLGDLEAIEVWMKAKSQWSAGDLTAAIEQLAGQHGDNHLKRVAMRLADRLSQRHRKAGSVVAAHAQGERAKWRWK